LQLALVLVALIAVSGAYALWHARQSRANGTDSVSTQAAGRYADPAKCALCHAGIAATYQKTGMGRAFHRVGGKGSDEPVPGKPYHHAASDSFFQMLERDGKLVQRRWQIGFDGKETNVDEKSVDYVLGSGNHARTYLHLTDKNTLQQLPLGWYAEKGGFWAMNPGYDRPDYAGSVRPIYYECMFCHNGYPKIPSGPNRDMSQMTYLPPLPEGIDCQRCHGPGQEHVDRASEGGAVEAIRAAIVNPRKLNSDSAMEVCLQCHLETSNQKLPHAIVRFDRIPFSHVPGQPLGDYEIVFNRVQGNLKNFEIAQGAYRFRESECFRKSAGRLSCTTCHNPHDIPRGEQATTHYNQVCRNCHQSVTQASSVTPASSAGPHKADANCVSCHMPKRRTDDAIHVVMTDHLISRRPPAGDLLAEKKERAETGADSYQGEVVPYYPPKLAASADNELTIAVAQVREQSNLTKGLPLLAAQIEKYRPSQPAYYAELAEGYLTAGNTASAIRFFEEAAKRDPQSAPRLIEWGDALMKAGQWTAAEAKLRRATELAPGDLRAWGRLGWALWQQNKAAEARAALEKGIGLDSEVPELHNDLGLLLWGTGDPAGAEREFRAAIRIQPGVAEWRLTLGKVLASQGKLPEARFQLEQSLRSKPDYAEARVDYARVLADLNQPADAEKQARLAVEGDPRSAAAHELWGALLAGRGDLPGAKRELSEAVQLQPEHARAQVELGMVLARQGDRAGAIPHLTAAAQGSDPNIRAAAEQALRALNGR
jgi:predicted CXXCH cytochrome family protein